MWKLLPFAGLIVLGGIFLHKSESAPVSDTALSRSEAVVATQHVRFTLYPEGIQPSTATVRAGTISIAIEDLAGANGGVLVERLDRGEPATVGTVQRFDRHWRGRSSVYLTPGRYRLRIAGAPANPAELTVNP